ncbi:MAG: ABC transporter permease [Gemmatimonadota bacterium]|nr:MAG: ABC transporter permease [Gemmatimonadota bacterium]
MSRRDSGGRDPVRPPRLAEALVASFAIGAVREAIRSDLAERFAVMAREDLLGAKRWYWGQALRCLSPTNRINVARRTRFGVRLARGSFLSGSPQDVRHAARGLARQPGFTLTAVVTLGIGIGATTAIFSVVNGVLLRPLPYPSPERLVNVWQVNTGWFDSPNLSLRSWASEFPASMPTFHDWEELSAVFQNVGAYDDRSYTLLGGDRPERIYGTRVTSGVWRALGVAPLLGRTFGPEDDGVGAAPLAVLNHSFWERRFGSDSSVAGTTIRLNGTAHTVVGVMPAGFYFPGAGYSVWTTFDDESKATDRNRQYLFAIARLKPGIDLDRAQREMEALTARLVESRGHNPDFGVRLVPRINQVVGDVQLILLVLLGTVGVVLLISCVNIANMLLVRATDRRRELAIRSALGAWRGRLVRQLLSESLVLAVIGGVTGVLIAVAAFRPLLAALPSGLPRADEIALDHRVLLFAAAVSVVTGLVAGSLPALRAGRADVLETLQEGSRSSTAGRRRNWAQGSLVVSEIALAFVLLVAAGLLVKSFMQLTSVERGFNAERVLTFEFTVPASGLGRPARSATPRPAASLSSEQLRWFEYLTPLRDRLTAVPGVESAALADNMPFMGGTSSGTVTLETSSGMHETNVERSAVSPSYFRTLGIPITRGREFTGEDGPDAKPVAIVSDGMAQRYWPNEDPLGRRLKRSTLESDSPWVTIVGVAADVRHQGLDVAPRPKIYTPYAQAPRSRVDVLLKTRVPPAVVAGAIREAIADYDPIVPLPNIRELESVISLSVAAPRFRTGLVSLLAIIAGLLAVVGVYGVVAYTMAQRKSEMGIRMALGAKQSDVVRSVLGRGAALAAAGLAIGAAIAWAAVRLLNSFLFQTSAHDPATFLAAVIVLALAALAASYLPARRATRVDPVEALRAE